jgi:hypothetical protein
MAVQPSHLQKIGGRRPVRDEWRVECKYGGDAGMQMGIDIQE